MPKYKGKEIYEWQEWQDGMSGREIAWYKFLFKKEKLEHRIRQGISHWVQRVVRGWDDSDTWDLDILIAQFVAPRLKRFQELSGDIPDGLTEQEWQDKLNDMVYAMEFMSSGQRHKCHNQADWDRVQRGLSAFGDYFTHLGW